VSAFTLLLAPILQLVRLRSRSVVACGILHGTLSSTRLVSSAFVRGAGALGNASVPLALLLSNVILFAVIDRPRADAKWVTPCHDR
jgi:hypothetical protein